MVKKIKIIYKKQLFTPSYFGVFVNPFYIIRRGLFKGILSNVKFLNGRMLDFGCGQKPYKSIIKVQEYIGIDIEISGHNHNNEHIDFFYDGKVIPFSNNSFDSIFSSEVFEHIFNIEEIIKELYRVLKPNGYLLITLPFMWDEHEIPYDFARYTSFGIRHILEKDGFNVIKIENTSHSLETIFQMLSCYIYKCILPSKKIFKIILIPLIIAPINIIGIFLSKILPRNKSFYHNNIIVAQKI